MYQYHKRPYISASHLNDFIWALDPLSASSLPTPSHFTFRRRRLEHLQPNLFTKAPLHRLSFAISLSATSQAQVPEAKAKDIVVVVVVVVVVV